MDAKKILTVIFVMVSIAVFGQKPTVQQYLAPNSGTANFGTKKSFVMGDGTGNDTLWIDGRTFGEKAYFVDGYNHIILDSVMINPDEVFGAGIFTGKVPFGGTMWQRGDTMALVGVADYRAIVGGSSGYGMGYFDFNAQEISIAKVNGLGFNLESVTRHIPIYSNEYWLAGFIDKGVDSSELNLAIGTVVPHNYGTDVINVIDIGGRNYFLRPTGASDNVYIGAYTGDSATANSNIGFGNNTLRIDSIGENVAVGHNNQKVNKGGGNSGTGNLSMVRCRYCSDNSYLGFGTIEHFVVSNGAIAIGNSALQGYNGTNIELTNPIAIGNGAGYSGLGAYSIALGDGAGQEDSTTADMIWFGRNTDYIARGRGGSTDTLAFFGKIIPQSLKIRGLDDGGGLLTVDANGDVTATDAVDSFTVTILVANTGVFDNIFSSTYTPSLTNVTNVAASTAYVTGYYRVGTSVTVYGKVDIDATLAASTFTELGIALPIVSNLANEEDLGGNAISDAIASLTARVKGDAANNRASVVFKALSINNDSYSFEFSYQIK